MNKEYWFARGYYDGRSKGTPDEELLSLLKGADRKSYNTGYDAGVTDYCDYDMIGEVEDGLE